ncbi:MAG: anthranilate synthase component I [Lentisphaerae bacterium RIFOXYC12_FULL_60_16]|nr:MAG: anthranilate synthase component I [Lentisphaerae bacterium RIFOXYC12_FULL_60_16]OGV78687.1 MAG: anthranilate synthase component I [Lentisphaerae bacterium RIFOXYB12_FULL_60_10]
MFLPIETTYRSLAQSHDVVPVYREILADFETPVSVLARFRDRPNAFLLESMEGGETWGRYSFVGVDPELWFEADHAAGSAPGLERIRDVYRGLRVAEIEGLPRFCGGAVGFAGYEAIREFEQMPGPKPSRDGVVPRSRFLRADRLIVFDNVRHTLKIVICTRPREAGADPGQVYRAAMAEIDRLVDVLRQPVDCPVPACLKPVEFHSNLGREAYEAMVRKAREYIYTGDVIQVVLSQRFSASCDAAPIDLYRALRLLNPSPYTFFLKIGEQTLVGSSPEVMVRLTGNRVEVRPIAGTRRRGQTEQEDRALADELLSDEKEKAEHVMLVDLGRNDVGRVSEPGSVQVTDYMIIERYSHVMHLVSHVEGILSHGLDAYDVMRATFPAGTLSGAPKIRAMQIIHELEPAPRGVYGGAVGYVGYNGNMDLAITIRTLDVQGGLVSVQAGAGIVYDSDPAREYEETCHKAAAMMKAVAMAVDGLNLPDGAKQAANRPLTRE